MPLTLRADAGGFTLIELVIGMVLMLVVGSVATRAVIDGYTREQHGSAVQVATVDSVALSEQLGNDLRSMSMRETSPVVRNYDLPQLRNVVLFGAGLNDLRIAEPRRMQFVADVVGPEAFGAATGSAGPGYGPECVTYAVAADGSMTRTLTAFDGVASCSGTVLSSKQMLPPPPRVQRVGTQPAPEFLYRVRANPPATNRKDPLDPDDCRSQAPTPTITSARTRGWVVAVDLDLDAYAPRAAVVGSNELHSSIAVRTRLSHDYQYALGCSY